MKKVFFKNFAIFTGKQEWLFNEVADLKACNFIKKRPQHMFFPVNIAKFLRTLILKNINKRLLLLVVPVTVCLRYWRNKIWDEINQAEINIQPFKFISDMPTLPIREGDSRFGSFNLSPARFLKSCRNFQFFRYTH